MHYIGSSTMMLCRQLQQGEWTSISHVAHLECSVLALLSPTAPSKYAEALYESRQVDLEGERAISTVRKLLEETGLDERIGLDALGLLHRHFETLTTQETRTHLHNDPNTHP